MNWQKKLDAVLKSYLAVTEIKEFDIITKQIYDEIKTNPQNEKSIKALKKKLISIPGPNELAYEISLRKHNIYRSDAHGGGFTGKNAYTLF